MKKNNSLLTASELQVMECLWTKNCPMTSVELAEESEEAGWKSSYVYILLRSLLKKGLIEVCGTTQYGTQYARQFRPLLTREEYAARMAASLNLERGSISRVAVALVREFSEDSEEVIADLEEMIRSIREDGEA